MKHDYWLGIRNKATENSINYTKSYSESLIKFQNFLHPKMSSFLYVSLTNYSKQLFLSHKRIFSILSFVSPWIRAWPFMGLEMLWVSLVEIGPSWGSEKEHENLRKSFLMPTKDYMEPLVPRASLLTMIRQLLKSIV